MQISSKYLLVTQKKTNTTQPILRFFKLPWHTLWVWNKYKYFFTFWRLPLTLISKIKTLKVFWLKILIKHYLWWLHLTWFWRSCTPFSASDFSLFTHRNFVYTWIPRNHQFKANLRVYCASSERKRNFVISPVVLILKPFYWVSILIIGTRVLDVGKVK